MKYTLQERIELVLIYAQDGCTLQRASEIFHLRHPGRPNPPTLRTVSKLMEKFKRTGSVADDKRSGRPKTATSVEMQEMVVASVLNTKQQSLRELQNDAGISTNSVGRILKLHKFHPYKIKLVQELVEDDFDRRIQFCENIMEINIRDPTFVRRICFSDEATFHLKGTVNRHNCRYWSQSNDHVFREYHTQYPEKINVWAGIYGDNIVGPFFIRENLTGDLYLRLLQDKVGPRLAELVPDDEGVIFQQDGAPPHYAVDVREYLNEAFPNSWIGRRGAYEWPARSPDLSPLDFFLWGHIKSIVYRTEPGTIQELEERIEAVCADITPEIFNNVRNEFSSRLGYCQEVLGAQFEQMTE